MGLLENCPANIHTRRTLSQISSCRWSRDTFMGSARAVVIARRVGKNRGEGNPYENRQTHPVGAGSSYCHRAGRRLHTTELDRPRPGSEAKRGTVERAHVAWRCQCEYLWRE